MKRMVLYLIILVSVLTVPVKPIDVDELIPVQVVSVQDENGWVTIKTDTGEKGLGATSRQALRNLKETAVGKIYLETAEFLLIGKNAEDAVEELRDELKGSVQICQVSTEVGLDSAAKFLRTHGDLPKLETWQKGMELPVLSVFGNSLIFFKKVEKSS